MTLPAHRSAKTKHVRQPARKSAPKRLRSPEAVPAHPRAARAPRAPRAPLKLRPSYIAVLISSVGLGFGVFYSYASYRAKVRTPLPTDDEIQSANASLADTWKDQLHALGYDGEVDSIEYWSGIFNRRKELSSLARGHVLESAVGSGRNVGLYDRSKVQSLTMVDQSRALLDICREKWDAEVQRTKATGGLFEARFLVGDLQGDGVGRVLRSAAAGEEQQPHKTPPSVDEAINDTHRFDTVLQTMGLCSTPNPARLLANLGAITKQDGRILLLEHGQSHYAWLNRLLDHTALAHARKHGCWWNRDIGAIVEASGLVVETIERYNFGTTWWCVLRPAPRAAASKPAEVEPKASTGEGVLGAVEGQLTNLAKWFW